MANNTPTTLPTPNADALENKNSTELQTMLQDTLSAGKYEEAKKIIAELEKKNTDFEMKDEKGKTLSERFTDFLNEKGVRTKQKIKEFFEKDIKTYIDNTETKTQTIQKGKDDMIAGLMNALNDKDSQIADITKERDEAINNLPSPREIIGQGRRMHGLFNNIKDLEANHKGSYPENALRLLMKQSKMQYFGGTRKGLTSLKMGWGKEMNGLSMRLFRLHKTDIYKHLEDIIKKVDDQATNGKGEWTKMQAKRLKSKITEVQNAYVEKEKNKVQGYVFGDSTKKAT